MPDKVTMQVSVSHHTYNWLKKVCDTSDHPSASVEDLAGVLLDHRVAAAENLGRRLDALWWPRVDATWPGSKESMAPKDAPGPFPVDADDDTKAVWRAQNGLPT